MIDISREETFSLLDAAKRLPCRRAGKRPNIATLYRWAQIGCRGIKLEVINIGATKCTSMEALQRFFDALTEQSQERSAPAAMATRMTPERRRQIEAAAEKLRAAGI